MLLDVPRSRPLASPFRIDFHSNSSDLIIDSKSLDLGGGEEPNAPPPPLLPFFILKNSIKINYRYIPRQRNVS